MRQHKYRAWSEYHQILGDVYMLDWEHGIVQIRTSEGATHTLGLSTVRLLQCTGQTDSEGTDLYEGDVIQFSYWWFDGAERESLLTGVIVYSKDHMSYQMKGVKNKEWQEHTGENDDDHLTPFSELNFQESDFRSLGNIHQNPELLEQAS